MASFALQPAANRTVLILGASGRFGSAAVQAFAAAGWRVLAQSRSATASGLPVGATPVARGLDDPAAVAAAAAGATVVVHAVNPVYARWAQEAVPLARAGLDVARALGAAFMLPGNVYNFGADMPALLLEDTPQRPTSLKGRLRVEIESLMAERARDGQRSVVIRAGDFYGSGHGSWLDLAVVKSIASGKLVYPGPLDVPHAWAYVPDLARAFVAVAERGLGPASPSFRCLHFAGHTLTGGQFLDALERAADSLGLRPGRGFRRGGMPWGLIKLASPLVPTWAAVAEVEYLWRVPHSMGGRALLQVAGPLTATPVEAALRQSLVDLGLAPIAHPIAA